MFVHICVDMYVCACVHGCALRGGTFAPSRSTQASEFFRKRQELRKQARERQGGLRRRRLRRASHVPCELCLGVSGCAPCVHIASASGADAGAPSVDPGLATFTVCVHAHCALRVARSGRPQQQTLGFEPRFSRAHESFKRVRDRALLSIARALIVHGLYGGCAPQAAIIRSKDERRRYRLAPLFLSSLLL